VSNIVLINHVKDGNSEDVQNIADLDVAAGLELKLDFWRVLSVPAQRRLSGS
jgi:hypothetical protein